MSFINYVSNIAVPITIFLILLFGLKEKINIFDCFINGAEGGLKMTLKIVPSIIGLFLAIGALSESGIINFITNLMEPILNMIKFPKEIIPLAMIRPISGSGSIAIATDIMTKYGVDSKLGLMAATIMGSTETTFYTIAIYTSSVNIKKTRFLLVAALMADLTGIIVSVVFWQILSKCFC